MAIRKDASQTGLLLKEARVASGLTQEDAAHLAGVRQGTYSRWERGKQRVPEAALRVLAPALGKPVEFFGVEAKRLGEKVPRGTVATVRESSPANGQGRADPLRALRLVQNDLERDLLESGAPEALVVAAGRIFGEWSREVRELLAHAAAGTVPHDPEHHHYTREELDAAAIQAEKDEQAIAERKRREAAAGGGHRPRRGRAAGGG